MRHLGLALLLTGCIGVVTDPGTDPDGPSGANCDAPPALTGESQRLDPDELAHALEDALGYRPDVDGMPAPLASHGFSTAPSANVISFDDTRAIAEVADRIALDARGRYDAFLPCAAANIDRACVQTFLSTFVPRLYRGAQGPDDEARLLALYDTLRGGDDPLEPGLALAGVLSAALQSPGFLYLLEIGQPDGDGVRRLTGREVANRLAFVLWDAPPDEALLAAAASGELDTPEGRRAQAERLLGSPNARVPVTRFFREWFGVHRADPGDQVDPALAQAMLEEFTRTVEHRVFDAGAGGLPSLLGGTTTFVNRSLAMHYGLAEVPADDETWVEVTLEDGRRAGLLGSAIVSSAHSNISETAIIRRGHWVREALLCDELGTPPPGATDRQPASAPDATPRERSELRGEVSGCAHCHTQMDPIGLGMEDLDPLGRLRDTYASGRPIDATGEVMGVTDGQFTGVEELGQLLSRDQALTQCGSAQWFRFAMGREVGSACHGGWATEAVEASGGDLRELLLRLVESDSFVLRADPREG